MHIDGVYELFPLIYNSYMVFVTNKKNKKNKIVFEINSRRFELEIKQKIIHIKY